MTYVRALFLADVLRRADLHVREVDGWRTRGRPASVGSFDPRALMLHHDASSKGPSPSVLRIIRDGREGLPGPLSQLWHTFGVWHVVASGRCNAGGLGNGWGRIPRDSANTYAIHVETDHTTGEPWREDDLDSLVRGFAALADAMSIDPARSLCGHKEYAPTRKIDPAGISMDAFRIKVERTMRDLRASRDRPVPRRVTKLKTVDLSDLRAAARRDPDTPGDLGTPGSRRDVFTVEGWLAREGFLGERRRDGDWSEATRRAYADWQRHLGFRGQDANGIPGLVSLTKLARAHNATVRR